MDPEFQYYQSAREDFRRARRLAVLKEISARLRGESVGLLPFEKVRNVIKIEGEQPRGLQQIPLDAIVGSVGRYTDFTRDFLPRKDSNITRWARVKSAIRRSGELRPIDVYKIDQVFFVLDGNHRVSVARERGLDQIPAFVTEIESKVHITPDTDFDELIISAEYCNFIENTRINELSQYQDLAVTVPGQYPILENQIELFRQDYDSRNNSQISSQQAASLWYQEVYVPVIQLIRTRGILRDFPDRTETDFFVWIVQHQEKVHREMGWDLEPTVVATDISDQFGNSFKLTVSRRLGSMYDKLMPDLFKRGPRPGKFRVHQKKIHAHDPAHLFTHMLLPLSGEAESWRALEFGLRLAWREEAHLLGLHIIQDRTNQSQRDIDKLKARFKRQCQNTGLPGEMALDTGAIVPTICKHARLSDLVIIHLAHPPGEHPMMRVDSGIRKLIQQSPRPIFAVPRVPKNFERLLVAYNGSPRSREALYAAAYFAGRWETPIFVLTVVETQKVDFKHINHARYYLRSRGIPATFIQKEGDVATVILEVQKEKDCNLIFIGGYSKPPMLDIAMGSPLDKVLRLSAVPVLICR